MDREMEQLIDKCAVVAGIENRIKELQNLYKENKEKLDSIQKTAIFLCIDECKGILSFLNTLEIKEVDMEKEIKDYIYTLPHSRTGIPGGWKCSWSEEEVIKIVKHFLNLD